MATKRNSEDIDIAKESEERILNAIQDSSNDSKNLKTFLKQNILGYIVTAIAVLGIYFAVCCVVWAVLRKWYS